MDNSLLLILLIFLTFAVGLNLLLTFRLTTIVLELPIGSGQSSGLPLGEMVPDFEAFNLLDHNSISATVKIEQPLVLVFLAPGCKDCRGKLPELKQLQPALKKSDVLMWVIGLGSKRQNKNFLKASGLLDSAFMMDAETRKLLNPLDASPSYLFIDGNKILQASGIIGDENWLSFLEQMHETEQEVSQEIVQEVVQENVQEIEL